MPDCTTEDTEDTEAFAGSSIHSGALRKQLYAGILVSRRAIPQFEMLK